MQFSKKALAQTLVETHLNELGPFSTTVLSSGLSYSPIIKVHTPRKDYVVRFWDMESWAQYFPHDATCQQIASEAGYGPKIHFLDRTYGISIMDYFLPELLSQSPEKFKVLAQLIKKIQSGPPFPQTIDRWSHIDELIQEMDKHPCLDLKEISKMYRTIRETVSLTGKQVPSHRDLHHANLLYTQGRLFAIDYTWAGIDDSYVDLANVAVFNCINFEEENLLLELYLEQKPSEQEKARLSLMKQPIKIFYALELLQLVSAHLSKESYMQIPSKSYRDLGHGDFSILTPTELINYGMLFLNEVISYAQSSQYIEDMLKIK